MRPLLGFASISLLLAPPTAAAQDRQTLRAHPRGDAEITLDGRLDEPIWDEAPEGSGFTTRRPTPGLTPPVDTRFRVLFDAEAIYVGVVMDLLPGETPRALELRRDSFNMYSDDAVTLKIDVARDRRTTVGFAVNPAGTQLDYVAVDNGRGFRTEYDAVWEAATAVNEDTWVAEYRVPVAALGMSAEEGERTFGFNVTRDHNARFATDDWNEIPEEFGPVSAPHYGDVTGLRGMGGGRPLTLVPYVLATLPRQRTYDPGGNVRGGGDIRLRLAEDVWSELTLLTDFAQVDLDDAVVNLDRFPLFFPEKRPFFLSGLEVFEFGQQGAAQLFFSRRIGLDADGEEIPLLGGFKLYGHAGPVGFGFLNAITADPISDWGVARLRVNAGDSAHVGVLSTYRDDFDLDGSSTSVGADATVRALDERVELSGSYAMTEVTEEDVAPDCGDDGVCETMDDPPPVVRSDNRRNRGSGFARLRYRSDELRPFITFLWVGDEFDPDVGFVRRRGIANSEIEVPIVLRPGGFRDVTITPEVEITTTDEIDRRLGGEVEISLEPRFNAWGFRLTAGLEEDTVLDAFDLLGEIPIDADTYRGAFVDYVIYASSDRNPHGSVGYSASSVFFGGTIQTVTASGGVSIGPHLRLGTTGRLGFLSIPTFPEERRALTVSSTVTVAPSTRLFLDAIFQVTDVSASQLNDGIAALGRIRWRYLPGSDLFLVGRVSDTPDEPPDWRVTLKLNYRYDALL